MEGVIKKTRYVQKSLFSQAKLQATGKLQQANTVKYIQKQQKLPEQAKTTVINVKVAQLRKKGYQSLVQWLQDSNHVYIGRRNHYVPGAQQSQWANPFKVNDYGRDGCIQKYKEYILSTPKMLAAVKKLKGKVLGCWCAPENCHGDILAELAEAKQ